jgi:IS5 family transposase
MTQLGLGLDLSTERTRKRDILDEMRRVVPRSKLIALIEPHYPAGNIKRYRIFLRRTGNKKARA